MEICEHIKAKGKPDYTSLYNHLKQVVAAIEKIAEIYDKLADNSKVIPEYLRKLSEISKGKHITREEFLKRL